MNCLELFSGTGSFGKVVKECGMNVISLDLLLPADINIDILKWDYKIYPPNHFDIVWASPPCVSYSILNNSIKKDEGVWETEMKEADKIVLKTLEIIDYFKPYYYYIENPYGMLRKRDIMKDKFYHVIDYCMYCDWGYRKRTCIWTNKTDWLPLTCDKNCGNMIGNKHKNNLGNTKRNKETGGSVLTLHKRYRIPPDLIYSLIFD